MASQSVVVKVDTVPQSVVFDNVAQAYTAVVPVETADNYQVEIDAVDLSLNTTTLITFFPTANGDLVKILATGYAASPVQGLKITASYKNISGGTDHGRADVQTTGTDGIAYLNLATGTYNLKFEKDSFSTKIIKNFQVFSGVNLFDAAGPIPHTHFVLDQLGAAIPGVNVKIEDTSIAGAPTLIAVRQTDSLGSWSAMIPQARPLAFTFEKEAFDMQKVGVQSV